MSDNTKLIELPFGTRVPGKPDGAFVAIHCRCAHWSEAPHVPADMRVKEWPHVLLFNRWDGRVGLVGGKVDPGESLAGAVARESREEIGWSVPNDLLVREEPSFRPLCTHEAEKIVVHAFEYDLGKVHVGYLRWVLQLAAAVGVVEGSPYWAPLAEYKSGLGFPQVLQSNFATAVAEELQCLVRKLREEGKL